MKKRNDLHTAIIIVILAILVIFLWNPALIPFLNEETRGAILATLRSAFGTADGGLPVFSLPTFIGLLAAICTLVGITMLLRLILTRITMHSGRSRTVAGLLLSVTNYAAVIIGFVWGLTILGVNVTGIFASLGLVSLIIGFGAQSLIEDIITGIFIIFEGQYNVGDIIIWDNFRGVVRSIGVRTTSLEDAGGNVKIINNSNVRNLQNRSQNLSVAICDVGISYDAKLPQVEAVLNAALPAMAQKSEGMFPAGLEYAGVQELGDSAVVLRIVGKVQEDNIFVAQRYLNRAVKLLFDEHGIEIPFTQIDLHTK